MSSSSHFPDREVESLSLLVFRRHRSKSIPGPGQQQAEESLIEMPAQQLADTKGAKAKIVSATATAIPYNPSSQHLMKTNELSELDLPNHDYIQYKTATSRTPHHITKRQWLTVTILFFVNLINYMDRLTIAGKIPFIMYPI